MARLTTHRDIPRLGVVLLGAHAHDLDAVLGGKIANLIHRIVLVAIHIQVHRASPQLDIAITRLACSLKERLDAVVTMVDVHERKLGYGHSPPLSYGLLKNRGLPHMRQAPKDRRNR